MTRLGENSKMIFLGDENQIDMKKKGESSLNFIIKKFSDFDEVGTITLGEDDVVRNPLIKKIEKIFNENKM
jgi:phosphate starvation-inducible protein PhoH